LEVEIRGMLYGWWYDIYSLVGLSGIQTVRHNNTNIEICETRRYDKSPLEKKFKMLLENGAIIVQTMLAVPLTV